ncbi:MAG: hypothetical protein GY850_02030 [bacterium]|nr:hypothetical protein [bacterium]
MAQKWYEKATVQAAIAGAVIAGIFGIVVALIGRHGGSPSVQIVVASSEDLRELLIARPNEGWFTMETNL